MTIDANATTVNAQDYYPFGDILREYTTSSIEEKYKFTGKERDIGTGYDYFGARYYDSFLGRWLSVDPLSGLYPGLSPYNYSLNNPINLIDKLGLGAVRSDPAMKPVGLINQNWWGFSPQFMAPSVFEGSPAPNNSSSNNSVSEKPAKKRSSTVKQDLYYYNLTGNNIFLNWEFGYVFEHSLRGRVFAKWGLALGNTESIGIELGFFPNSSYEIFQGKMIDPYFENPFEVEFSSRYLGFQGVIDHISGQITSYGPTLSLGTGNLTINASNLSYTSKTFNLGQLFYYLVLKNPLINIP